MINFTGFIKEHNLTWPQIPDDPQKILTIEGSGSEKTYLLFHLIIQQPVVDKIYLYVKDQYKAKYQFLINKQESTELKCLNVSKVLIEYSNDMDRIFKILKNTIQIRNAKYRLIK